MLTGIPEVPGVPPTPGGPAEPYNDKDNIHENYKFGEEEWT